MERRDFLNKCGTLCAVGIGGAMLVNLAACKSPEFTASAMDGNRIKVMKSDFPAEKSFIVVKNPTGDAPIYIHRTGENYMAILLHCTHRGCTVNAGADELKCPCHGSRYSTDGQVIKGPAQKPLKSYPVDTDQVALYITVV
jgi:cytochrome b6-f complex iron-sulfur subunit